ncbi:GFA family protein [Sinorhizobium sp. BG8]|uniref:GFA family protein n=1 Tax=Sinorhizobium sp. BG8 TaxID=2613773 RepID=UPI00193D6E29|nr:GFA family protein [Sinorhizobium sp. BG8]QRM53994.1 GFA family protein [Sinorhizobium sp. BG8]
MHIDGQCHCGHVTYEAEIDPRMVSLCHCTDCQRMTGSPYRVTAITERDKIRIGSNPPKLYVKIGENGRRRLQYFCPECGSPLFTTGTDEDGDTWGIRWGSINQRAHLRPSRQIWCRSAANWFGECAALPGDERG